MRHNRRNGIDYGDVGHKNYDVGDIFTMLVRCSSDQICHQHPKLVTNSFRQNRFSR